MTQRLHRPNKKATTPGHHQQHRDEHQREGAGGSLPPQARRAVDGAADKSIKKTHHYKNPVSYTILQAPCILNIVKENEEEKKLTSLKQGGIYHFRNSNGTFKTAVIFPLHPRMAGLSQVILASDWPRDLILTPDWPRDLILASDWPTDLILTPDWLRDLTLTPD